MNYRSIAQFALSAALVASVGMTALADDKAAKAAYEQGMALYQHRDQAGKIDEALKVLGGAETQVATDNDLKFDILILEARCLYWKGEHTADTDQKKDIHTTGKDKADQAKALNGNYAEGYYYAGINLARWAEANGVIASLSHTDELTQYMKDASDVTRTTRDGKDGESIDGYGPDRVLGRMYEKLPGIFGGDHDLSVKYLQTAVQKAPTLALNTVYLAATLLNGGDDEKAQAKTLLQALVAQDPTKLDPTRVPETREELALAQGLLNGTPLP